MLHCFYANDLRLLKQALVRTLKDKSLSEPFQAEQIVVPGTGVSQWLKLALADDMGVSANIDYPMPSNFLWRCFHYFLAEVPVESDFNKDVMVWHLMEILPAQLDREEFISLKHYLKDAEPLRLYQLAKQIADVFDQYLVYRTQWINDWERGDFSSAITQPWQPVLWQALCQRMRDADKQPLNRANLFEQFKKTLQGDDFSNSLGFERLPSRIFFFGFTNLPPIYLELISLLGKHYEVYLLVDNPCRYFWGDVKSAKELEHHKLSDEESDHLSSNELLASWGKQGREFLSLIQQYPMEESEYYLDHRRDTLLASIQQDILDGADRSIENLCALSSEGKQVISDSDFSISFHSHYSLMREVEVLHDQLLNLFEQDAELSQKDIVVMVPDINRYSPYIHAVFGSAKLIPFSVADRASYSEEPALLSLLTLMQLPLSRISVSEVLELLEQRSVRRRFDISAHEFQTLKEWINESGIRWGLDGRHRQDLGLPDFEQNSWRFGLRRMLAGYSMGGESLYKGTASYDEVSGGEAVLAGKLGHFIDTLEKTREAIAGEYSAARWIQKTNQLVEDFYCFESGDELVLQPLWQALEAFKKQTDQAQLNSRLSYAVFNHYLNTALNDASNSTRFLMGQVSFCTLLPKRAIPFKVVCLLGMNEGDFPKTMISSGFDLMAQAVQAGDRSRRDEERYLFLEAFLAAQNKLYISWVGRSIQDNSLKHPSLLVSELLDYCCNNYCLEGDLNASPLCSAENLRAFLITGHPLQSFSAENFVRDPNTPLRFSYAQDWLPLSNGSNIEDSFSAGNGFFEARDESTPAWHNDETSTVKQNMLAAETVKVIQLDALLRFFNHPTRYFFRNHLQVNFSDYSTEQFDHEPFEVDGLSNYQLKQTFLQQALATVDKQSAFDYQLASGLIPQGFSGLRTLNKADQDISQFAGVLKPFLINPQAALEINIILGGINLQAWLDGQFDTGLVEYKPSKLKAGDFIRTWIKHLARCAMQPGSAMFACQQNSTLLGFNSKEQKVEHYSYLPVPVEQAREHLQVLVDIYITALNEPIPFFPQAAWEWYKVWETDPQGEDITEKAMDKASKAFKSTDFSRVPGEGEDASVARVFPELEAVQAPFVQLTKAIFGPLSDALVKTEEEGV